MPTDPAPKQEFTVQGVPASPGIAFGQVFVLLHREVAIPEYRIEPEKRASEIARFEKALLQTRQQLSRIRSEVAKSLGPDEARIFDAHLTVLEDPALIGESIRELETTGKNIETCFNAVSQRYIKAFSELEDEYFRERVGDIRDVAQRVLQNLLGQADNSLGNLAGKRVVVANEISPSDSAGINPAAAIAIVSESGSKTSHAAIIAQSMRVPAVVGARNLTSRVVNDDWAIVDGFDGVVIINPTEETLFRYGKIEQHRKLFAQRLTDASRQPAVTLDGVSVELMANIERVDEVPQVREYTAAGVGLFRTEYIFLNSSRLPTEQEQFLAYKSVAEAMAPRPVVIRTLDLGGDKPMSGAPPGMFVKEANPFLGYRAIRFCLDNPAIFKDQLRAILLASHYGNVRLMYPMISGAEELSRANAVLAECKAELRERGQPFDENLATGAMIEIPSAAATVDLLAPQCRFFSIGTNDLIQYLLAIDRGNDRIASLYEPTHPAVLRTLKHIVDAARLAGVRVAVCGEMAGDPVYAPLLLGLGVDELSMTPTWLPSVKFLIRSMTMSDARALAAEALSMVEPRKIHEKCDAFYRARVKVE